LNKLIGLKYAKEMWDKLESIFGNGTNNNMENEKKWNKKKKKKELQNQEAQPQESHLPSASDSTNNV